MAFPALAIGLAAGLLGGLLGLGGGVVIVPALTEILHLGQRRAQATSLAVLVFTGLFGFLSYLAYGSVPLGPALWVTVGAVLAAPAGASLTHRISRRKLRALFGILLVFVGIVMLTGLKELPGEGGVAGVPGWVFFVLGVLRGGIGAMLGVGGGVIVVPALVLLFGVKQHVAQGISLAAMAPMALVGSWTHWRHRKIEFRLLPGLVIGGLLGVVLGSTVAHWLPAGVLRRLFAVFLIFFGVQYARGNHLRRPSS